MRYLYGDSTESELEFNYLAFLRQALDCSVLLMKHKVGRDTAAERRRTKEQEVTLAIKSLEELGVQVHQSYSPLTKDNSPVGRVMTAMVEAAMEAISHESVALRTTARFEIDREIQEDRADRLRCVSALEALLCAHDLPGAEVSREVIWKEAARAQLTARAKYATAVVALEIPSGSSLAGEPRIERLVDNLEIMAIEEAGWMKKQHKLVPHRLGRFVVTRLVVGRDATTIRLRGETGVSLEVTIPKSGEITAERTSEQGMREPTVDAKQRPAFRQLADKLEAAVRALDKRTQLVSLEIEDASILDHPKPHVLAERLIEMIAPVVQQIAKHSRNPDELVLRRLLGDDRREEIFVTIKELAGKLESLPADARSVFAPLGLGAAATATAAEPTSPPPPPAPAPRPRAQTEPVELSSTDVLEESADGPPTDAPSAVRATQIAKKRTTGPGEAQRDAATPARLVRPSEDVAAAVEAALDAMADERPAPPPAVDAKATEDAATTSAPPASTAPRSVRDSAIETSAPDLRASEASVISELLAAKDKKPLPRALIIETGEYQPLVKPAPDAPTG